MVLVQSQFPPTFLPGQKSGWLWRHIYFLFGSTARSWSGLAREKRAHTSHCALRLSLCNKAISMTWIFQCRRVKWLFPAFWPYKYVNLYGARPFHYWDFGLVACRLPIPYSTCGMLRSRVIVPFLLLLHFP